MIIKNKKQLSTTHTRKNALAIIEKGLEAVMTKPTLQKDIQVTRNTLKIQKHSWNLSKYKNIYVIGAGKASADMAEILEKKLRKRITKGIVIDTQTRNLKYISVKRGTHPLPSKQNLNATKDILTIVEHAHKEDLIIALISGGGSALLTSPRIPLSQFIILNKKLVQSGATIQEINTIRKHLSLVKGGQLAHRAHPATLITLIISDVITNDLSVIASGPTVKDASTVPDAEKIRKKYNLGSLPFVETPKKIPHNTTNILLITNTHAANAMKKEAQTRGYVSRILSTKLTGEARTIGKKLAKNIQSNTALIATGETTVTVNGKGKGGRNQELALAASEYIKNGTLISCASDGVDFIVEAAGGIVDEHTKEIARKKNINLKDQLAHNNTYPILKKLQGIIKTGKTGTNVADLILVLGNQKT